MTYSKSAANPLGTRKQDNASGACAADTEQIIIWLAENTVNAITEIMSCSKAAAKVMCYANEMKQTVYVLMIWQRPLCSRSKCNQ